MIKKKAKIYLKRKSKKKIINPMKKEKWRRTEYLRYINYILRGRQIQIMKMKAVKEIELIMIIQ